MGNSKWGCQWNGKQLRALNELPTLLLVIVVMLVVFKTHSPPVATWFIVALWCLRTDSVLCPLASSRAEAAAAEPSSRTSPWSRIPPLTSVLETIKPRAVRAAEFPLPHALQRWQPRASRSHSPASANGLRHPAVTDHHSSAAYIHAALPVEQQNRATLSQPCGRAWRSAQFLVVSHAGAWLEHGYLALAVYNRGDVAVGEALRADSVCRAIHDAGGLGDLPSSPPSMGFPELIDAAADLVLMAGEAWYDYDMQPRWNWSPVVQGLTNA